MALVRWQEESNMLSQLDRMRREMDTLFSSLSPFGSSWARPGYRTDVYPPVNVYRDEEGFLVRAEVPGIDPKSLDIDIAGDTLTLRGERKAPELPKGASYHRRECDCGQFSRSLTLPDRVDPKSVVAKCEHGVLEIRLPHAEETKTRKIAIKSS